MSESALAERIGVPTGEGRPVGWWGIMLTIATEAVLFALLLFVWYYLRTQSPTWPPEGIPMPELFRSGIRTGLLLFSSIPVSFADRGIKKGKKWRLLVGFPLAFALGSVFLAGHVNEMLKLPAEYTWATNAYGSARYTILNFHAAHLSVGLAFLAYGYIGALKGRYNADSHLGVTVVSLYWHFVDVVWVFVYGSLYLLPHFADFSVPQ